jgi:predicted nucleic acid-binding Zn ribbon protein
VFVPPCRTAGDKFNKEYAYNVRYNYGQEGKRQDWSEWSCVKIINQVRQRDRNMLLLLLLLLLLPPLQLHLLGLT